MIRIRRALIVLQVASHARAAGQVVIVVDMAIGALSRRDGVGACERESCAVMVEGRVQPRAGVVALITSLRKIRAYVIWIRRALIIFQVASHASCAGQVVIVVDMTIGALSRRDGVHARKREFRQVVVE